MWTKIYLALTLIGVVAAGFFAFYAWSWLQSIGEPSAAWEAFNYHKRGGVYFAAVWTLVLLVAGNVILWTRASPWALWVSEIYFVLTASTFLVWLHVSGITFCTNNLVCDEPPSRAAGPLITILASLALTVVILIDQFASLRIRDKLYGRAIEDRDSKTSPPAES